MPKLLRPVTKSQFNVTIANVQGTFSKCSGGEEEYDTGEYVDPSDRRKKTVKGPLKVSNLTLSKPYHPTDDAPLVDFWQTYRDNGTPEQITVTKQAVKDDKNKTAIGRPSTYYGCQMIKFTRPEADMESSDAAMLEIELSVDYVEES